MLRVVYFAGRWWFALWGRNHQESIFSEVLDALHWAQAKCSEISAQYDLWKGFKRAAWQVCTCHLVLSYIEPVCLTHINDVCFFSVSYKLWYNYLRERRKQVKGKCITDPAYEEVNNCHERALVFMHKVKLTFHAFSSLFCVTVVWFDGWIFSSVSSDAEDMDRLLSVHGVSMQNYTEPTDVR